MKHRSYPCTCGRPVKIKTDYLRECREIFCKGCGRKVPEKERTARLKLAMFKLTKEERIKRSKK